MKKLLLFIRNNKKIITSFTSCLSLFVLLVITITITFTWFNSNKDVIAKGMSVHISSPDISSATLTVRPVNDISNNEFTFDPFSVTNKLPTHDPNGIIVSEYKKAIVLEFSFSLSRVMDIKIQVNAGASWTNNHNNYLSNCITISMPSSVNGTKINTTSGNTYSFVTFPEGGLPQKTPSLSFIFQDIAAGNASIYLIMQYNLEAVDYINGHGTALEYTYENDLDFIISDISEGEL